MVDLRPFYVENHCTRALFLNHTSSRNAFNYSIGLWFESTTLECIYMFYKMKINWIGSLYLICNFSVGFFELFDRCKMDRHLQVVFRSPAIKVQFIKWKKPFKL